MNEHDNDDGTAAVDEVEDLDELAADLEHETKLEGYRSWTRFILFVAVTVVAGAIAVLAMVFTGQGNAKDCEAKLRSMIPSAMAGVDHSDEKPRECKGLSDAELERIGEKVFADMVGTAFEGFAKSFGGQS